MGAFLRNRSTFYVLRSTPGNNPRTESHKYPPAVSKAAAVGALSVIIVLGAGTAAAQEEVTALADPETGAIELPDVGPRPPYPQAHLWRPLTLRQWQVEALADGRSAFDAGAVWHPSDVVFGASLGFLEQLQATVTLDLRAARAPGAANPEVAYAMDVGGTYAVYTTGDDVLSAAGALDLWIPLQATAAQTSMPPADPPYPTLVPLLQAVWRIVQPFGLRVALSLPVTLSSKATEILSLIVRPEVQPLDWLWLDVGAGISLRGSRDLLVPLDFELGLTPWRHFDVFASFGFPDLVGFGVGHRTLIMGLRVRPQDL